MSVSLDNASVAALKFTRHTRIADINYDRKVADKLALHACTSKLKLQMLSETRDAFNSSHD